MLGDLLQDLRYGLRGLRRSPGFTGMVVVSLALGIGANVAIFGLIEAVLMRSLPVPAPGQLVFFGEQVGTRNAGPRPVPGRQQALSYPLYRRLRDDPSFSGVAAEQSGQTQSVVRRAGGQEAGGEARGRCVTGNFFSVLGVRAFRGRVLEAGDETAPGANAVVVLSHRYWQRHLGADPAVVGERLLINGAAYQVVGIAAPAFLGTTMGTTTDFWVPITMQEQLMQPRAEDGVRSWLESKQQWFLIGIGRLAPGVSRQAAEGRVNARFAQYLTENPQVLGPGVQREQVHIELAAGARGASPFRQAVEYPLVLLMAGVGLLLLIVCLNLSHLLLARAARRAREMSIRTAMGATRWRLLRQLLAEGALLAALGGAAAVVVAPWLVTALMAFIPEPESLGIDLSVGAPVLSFSGGLSLAVAVLLALVPALRGAGTDLQRVLGATARSLTPGGSRRLVSRLLLSAQVALALVLLAAGGLLTNSVLRLRAADKGFEEEHLLLVTLNPARAGLSDERARALPETILPAVRALPGVQSASLSVFQLLGSNASSRPVTLPGQPGAPFPGITNAVTPGYFETTGIRLRRGRDFTAQDRAGAPRVTVISEGLARRLFGPRDPLGERMRDDLQDRRPDLTVVGVVRDVKSNQLRQEPRRSYYVPLAQEDDLATSLEVRVAGDPAVLAGAVRSALRAAVPELPVTSVRTMRAQVHQALGAERMMATLAVAFGLCALFLVSLGLYGLISHWAAQRTAEIGVRMALGATAGSVRWLVLRQALVLVALGVGVGVPAAMAAMRLLQGALFGVRPMDPSTLTVSALSMLAVATIAAYLPAWRASRIDPMAALRCE